MFYSLKRSISLSALVLITIALASCQTTRQTTEEENSQKTPPTKEENITQKDKNTPTENIAADEISLPPIPMKTIKGNGYTVEMGRTWTYMASLTAGQENTFAIDQYPGIKTTFNGSKVLITSFVNRFNSSEEKYLESFLASFSEFNVLETLKQPEGYFIIMNRKSDRNSLRYVRLYYHPSLKQLLAYNLTFRIIGDEQTYRKTQDIDDVAQEILDYFTLVL